MGARANELLELPRLRDAAHVFDDRHQAGEVVADLLRPRVDGSELVLALPAGGVPVATPIARTLQLPLDLACVSKITLPWNSESGYGAVAFDGTTRLNDALVERLHLPQAEVDAGIARTRDKVLHRHRTLRGGGPLPSLGARRLIVVDDGLASGFTMSVAVEALRRAGATHITVAVPTGHLSTVEQLMRETELVCCANVRSGLSFAVADAYRYWHDVSEQQVQRELESLD